MKPSLFLWLALFLPCFIQAQAAHTHADGTTHAAHEEETEAVSSAEHFTVYGVSDRYELTLYYPEITPGKEAHLTLFVADVASNRPIEKAVLDITTSGGAPGTMEVHPETPGVYEVHATLPEAKNYTLNVRITHPNGADLIAIQGVEVGKKRAVEPVASVEKSGNNPWVIFFGGLALGLLLMFFILKNRHRRLTAAVLLLSAWCSNPGINLAHGDDEHAPGGGGGGFGKSVAAPKETQFLFEVLTQPIAIGDYHSATNMYGTVVPAAGGFGALVAPYNGRISKVMVSVGQQVKAGQTLAVLYQNIQTPDQVGVATNNAGLAVQLETARKRVDATRLDLERLKKVADIAAGRDVRAAEAAYAQAVAELNVLENSAVSNNTTANNRTVSLIAPVSGVVGPFTLSPGAEVLAGQTLLNITNLNKVYVEAQVYDQDVPVVRAGNKFLVTCSTDDHKSAEVRLISGATTMNPGNQSQRVLFEMDNPRGEFKIGEFVTVKALDNSTLRQITVPNAAITEINGKTAVFVKHDPEIFELAYVQTGTDDGARTLILKGIEEGEKVVVNGAYEVKMMYLNQ
jgi:RND family efflux transporter MFP subunit